MRYLFPHPFVLFNIHFDITTPGPVRIRMGILRRTPRLVTNGVWLTLRDSLACVIIELYRLVHLCEWSG